MINIILIIALIVIAFVLLCITPEEVICHECGGKCDEIEHYATSMKRLYRCRKCGKEFWGSW